MIGRVMHACGGRRAFLELLALVVLVLAAGHVSSRFDLLDRYMEWTRAHEVYEFDELLTLAGFGLIGAIVFTVRRIGEIKREVALREASEARATYLAYHDSLTQLANREHFNARLSEALARSARTGEAVALLILDLDRFKLINDSLGHAAGDALLRSVGARLRGSVREMDTVARLGGDEFAVLQVGVAQPTGAGRLAERLLEVLSEPHDLEDQELTSSASIGIALAPGDAARPDELARHADTALYRAKAEGRGTARFFEEGMDTQLRARRDLERAMREGLARNGFRLDFQPIFTLPTHALIGFEALLRFDHPKLGPIPPAEIIPLAEESGMIIPLGAWILEAACREAVRWPGKHRVAVNLSPVQFRQGDIVKTVASTLAKTGLEARRLELEITETLLLEDTEMVLNKLTLLHELGVAIAMDDFGTGYSSLAYLWRFPFDKIKIDRSFISAMASDPRVKAIVDSILGLGATLGMKVTAEGIETIEQSSLLRRIGCEQGQGYFLGHPVPPELIDGIVQAAAGTAGD